MLMERRPGCCRDAAKTFKDALALAQHATKGREVLPDNCDPSRIQEMLRAASARQCQSLKAASRTHPSSTSFMESIEVHVFEEADASILKSSITYGPSSSLFYTSKIRCDTWCLQEQEQNITVYLALILYNLLDSTVKTA